MKTIKYYHLTSHIPSLEFDGDVKCMKLHHNTSFNWGFDEEYDYEWQESVLDSFVIESEYYHIYIGYDVSGYDYWMVRQEEPNYMDVCVKFECVDFPLDAIEQLNRDLITAIELCKSLQNDWQ